MNNSNNNYYRDWPIRWSGRGEEEVKEKDDAELLHWICTGSGPHCQQQQKLLLVGGFILAARRMRRVCVTKKGNRMAIIIASGRGDLGTNEKPAMITRSLHWFCSWYARDCFTFPSIIAADKVELRHRLWPAAAAKSVECDTRMGWLSQCRWDKAAKIFGNKLTEFVIIN